MTIRITLGEFETTYVPKITDYWNNLKDSYITLPPVPNVLSLSDVTELSDNLTNIVEDLGVNVLTDHVSDFLTSMKDNLAFPPFPDLGNLDIRMMKEFITSFDSLEINTVFSQYYLQNLLNGVNIPDAQIYVKDFLEVNLSPENVELTLEILPDYISESIKANVQVNLSTTLSTFFVNFTPGNPIPTPPNLSLPNLTDMIDNLPNFANRAGVTDITNYGKQVVDNFINGLPITDTFLEDTLQADMFNTFVDGLGNQNLINQFKGLKAKFIDGTSPPEAPENIYQNNNLKQLSIKTDTIGLSILAKNSYLHVEAGRRSKEVGEVSRKVLYQLAETELSKNTKYLETVLSNYRRQMNVFNSRMTN